MDAETRAAHAAHARHVATGEGVPVGWTDINQHPPFTFAMSGRREVGKALIAPDPSTYTASALALGTPILPEEAEFGRDLYFDRGSLRKWELGQVWPVKYRSEHAWLRPHPAPKSVVSKMEIAPAPTVDAGPVEIRVPSAYHTALDQIVHGEDPLRDQPKRYVEMLIRTDEEAIRAKLIELGWTPPTPHTAAPDPRDAAIIELTEIARRLHRHLRDAIEAGNRNRDLDQVQRILDNGNDLGFTINSALSKLEPKP